MNENQMTIEQKRAARRAQFSEKIGRFWFIYLALIGTATLSFVGGLLLPFRPNDAGIITVTFGTACAALFYSIGFLSTGEGASLYWFEKLTDQDPDNPTQKIISYLMLTVSVITSLITALAAASFIAYWLGVFTEFTGMPAWAQRWVVWAIPSMWAAHFIAGTIFKAVSDESQYEREAKSVVRQARNEAAKAKAQAKANWWRVNAPVIAQAMGEMEAQSEIDAYAASLSDKQRGQAITPPKVYTFQQTAEQVPGVLDSGPSSRQS